MNLLVISEKTDYIAQTLIRDLRNEPVPNMLVDFADSAATSKFDPNCYDIIMQIGCAAARLPDLRKAAPLHSGLILVPSVQDVSFRLRACKQLDHLKAQTASANLALCPDQAVQSFMEKAVDLPCRLLRYTQPPKVRSEKMSSPVKASAGLFIAVSVLEVEQYEDLTKNMATGKKSRKIHLCVASKKLSARASVKPAVNLSSVRNMVKSLSAYGHILLPAMAAQHAVVLHAARLSGRPVLFVEAEAAYDLLDGAPNLRVTTPDTFTADAQALMIRDIATGNTSAASGAMFDISSLMGTLKGLRPETRKLNTLMPYSSGLREPVDSDRPYVVFHHPYSIEPNRNAARPIRLRAMRDELASRYNVLEIYGDATIKMRRFKMLRDLIAEGREIAYCYSETSTHPFSDQQGKSFEAYLYAFLNRLDIPLVVFVRDAHWAEARYAEAMGGDRVVKPMAVRGAHDLAVIRRRANLITSPSDAFYARYIDTSPLPPNSQNAAHVALGPACNEVAVSTIDTTRAAGRPLRLIYAGGLSGIYNPELVARVIHDTPDLNVELTFLSRPKEHEAFFARHGDLANNPSLHFLVGRLKDILAVQNYDAGVLYLTETLYAKSAFPKKTIDYAAAGLPILANSGTSYALAIENHNMGLTTASEPDEVLKMLRLLRSNPDLLEDMSANALAYARSNRWSDRVDTVETALGLTTAKEIGNGSAT